MATNYIQPGDTLTLTAPTGGVVSSTAYLIGGLLVVAQETAAAGVLFDGTCVGVWTLPKATGTAWTEGVLLYWDNAAKNVTTVSTSNYRIGCAAAAAASGDTSGKVRLTGAPVPAGA